VKQDNELANCVRRALEAYVRDLDGEKAGSVYAMVMNAVERPLIAFALEHAQGNQTRAAEILGLNRNTLRKKIDEFGLKLP
jgi:Fis family transcriptional regulator, factor for inversion stimulation protein